MSIQQNYTGLTLAQLIEQTLAEGRCFVCVLKDRDTLATFAITGETGIEISVCDGCLAIQRQLNGAPEKVRAL